MLGVVGAGFDPTGGGAAYKSPQGWMLSTNFGLLFHARRSRRWQGQPQGETKLKQGDVVVRLPPVPLSMCSCIVLTSLAAQGMLLDFDAATLTVWVNGERRGVMVRPGMANTDDGQPVARLEGPLRWAVDLDGELKIDGPLPPPNV